MQLSKELEIDWETVDNHLETLQKHSLVKEMEISVGDVLDWETTMQGGRKIIRVKKLG